MHPTSWVFLKLWYLITLLIDERFFLFFLCIIFAIYTIATYNCILWGIAGFLGAEPKTLQKNRLFCKLRVFSILNSHNFQESTDKWVKFWIIIEDYKGHKLHKLRQIAPCASNTAMPWTWNKMTLFQGADFGGSCFPQGGKIKNCVGAVLFYFLCSFQWYITRSRIYNGCDVIWRQTLAKTRKTRKWGVFGGLYLPKLHGMPLQTLYFVVELSCAYVGAIARKINYRISMNLVYR